MSQAATELYDILSQNLEWNRARITCFVCMLMALFSVKTINLKAIATEFDSDAKMNSRYKRIQRFFRLFKIDFDVIAGLIFRWFGLSTGSHYLIIDRTNWKLGKKNINVLMLSVAYHGIAIPIFWKNLGRAGNSITAQRIELMNKFIDKFGTACISGPLGDREFIGKDWFNYLMENKIPFYIRIKENALVTNSRGKDVAVRQLFRGLKRGEIKILRKKRNIGNALLFLSATLDEAGKLKIIATDTDPINALKIFAVRQEIETLFGCLKTRGFRFEDTHVTHTDRIDRLLVLLAIGFCWAYKTGEWIHENLARIKLKSHGRREVSMFRYGLDFIRDTISKIERRYKDFEICLDQLRQPQKPSCLAGKEAVL